MTFTSAEDHLNFARAVRREFRYPRTPEQEAFLKAIATTSQSRILPLQAGRKLWRAQPGHATRETEQDGYLFQERNAHGPERMKPLPDKESDGRANPKGITCLYLATHKETSVLEVRPLIGSYVSIARFEILKDLRLINCSSKEIGDLVRYLKEDLTHDDIEKMVWSDINGAFSKPSERSDESLDYVPTQIIAELFKLNEFDGIAYKSSYRETGLNVALFDVSAADVISCQLHQVKDVSVTITAVANPYFTDRSIRPVAALVDDPRLPPTNDV